MRTSVSAVPVCFTTTGFFQSRLHAFSKRPVNRTSCPMPAFVLLTLQNQDIDQYIISYSVVRLYAPYISSVCITAGSETFNLNALLAWVRPYTARQKHSAFESRILIIYYNDVMNRFYAHKLAVNCGCFFVEMIQIHNNEDRRWKYTKRT